MLQIYNILSGYCPNLSGKIEINANVTGKLIDNNVDYFACFGYSTATRNNAKIVISGICSVLEEMVTDAKSYSSNSNIVIE